MNIEDKLSDEIKNNLNKKIISAIEKSLLKLKLNLNLKKIDYSDELKDMTDSISKKIINTIINDEIH